MSNATPNSDLLADFLTEAKLAAELGVSTRTIARWHQQRSGPPRVTIGKTVLYKTSSVRAWLDAREAAPVAARRGRGRR